MAMTKAQDAEVRSVAQTILNDHKMSNEQLKQIAQRKGIDLPAASGHGIKGSHTDGSGINRTDSESSSSSTKNTSGNTAGNTSGNTAGNTSGNTAGSTAGRNADGTARKGEYADDVGTRQDRATELERQRADGSRPYTEAEARQHATATTQRLQTASGAEFDRQYLTAMLEGHEKAISKYQMAAQQLSDADLKQYASAALPKLREHQNKVRSLAQARGISTSPHSTDGSVDRTDANKPVDRDPAGVRPK